MPLSAARPATAPLAGPAVLSGLVPLCDLEPGARRELLNGAEHRRCPAGSRLFSEGDTDKYSVYLLDGVVELRRGGRNVGRIRGGSPLARLPLAPELPRRLQAWCESEVEFLRVDRDLLEFLLDGAGPGTISVSELAEGDTRIECALFNRIYHAYMADQLVLPSLPDVAIRVRQALGKPDSDIGEVARIVQMDPAMTARLIQVANSPLYRGHGRIVDCRAAVTRLGLETTRNLLIGFSLRNLFTGHSGSTRHRMQQLWLHSSHVAAVCYVLATRTGAVDPELAMLAGVVHDIGVLPVLQYVDEFPELCSDRREVERAIRRLRGQVGAMVLRKWQFSDELITAALEAEDWARETGQGPDCCDLVLVAQLLCAVDGDRARHYPAPDAVPAWHRLALGSMADGAHLRVLNNARQELREVLNLLR